MGKIINEVKAKVNGFMDYLRISKAIAEDMVKNKKKISDVDKKIMKYKENGKKINEIKKDLEKEK